LSLGFTVFSAASMANTTKTTKVATPKANTPAPVDTVEALGKAIGARYVGYDALPPALYQASKSPKHKS
jgi:hypothetical protein